MSYELFVVTKSEGDKSSSVQFIIESDGSFLWIGSDGEPTEQFPSQSGWSFQDDDWNSFFQSFLEELKEIDLVEWSENMELEETLQIHERLTITREG